MSAGVDVGSMVVGSTICLPVSWDGGVVQGEGMTVSCMHPDKMMQIKQNTGMNFEDISRSNLKNFSITIDTLLFVMRSTHNLYHWIQVLWRVGAWI